MNDFKLGIKIVNAIIGDGQPEGFSYTFEKSFYNSDESERTCVYKVVMDDEECLISVVETIDSYDNNGGVKSIRIVKPVTKEITVYEEDI